MNTPVRFERPGFGLAAFVLVCMLFFIGIAPRNERALFLRDDSKVPAKAFSAVVPPLDATQSQVERSLLSNTRVPGARSGGTGAGSPNGRQPQIASNQGLLPGTLPSLLAGGTPGAATPGGSGADATPLGATPPPTGGQTPTSNTPTTAGNPPSAPGLPVPTAGSPATALPEPATWAMMLLGFFAVGGTMRRRAPSRAGSMSVAA
ncbi:hypothetical protein BH11PSE5_BH11PSE5_10770 [soil metagenome]